ncbi:MAG: hypothetical protein MK085_13930, partial [Phycisphaerales bacterium]|nr:hypothetical protein [Phycisphaerales bacterium]
MFTASNNPNAPRLNLLLTYGGWRERPAVEQLPQLLHPLGIRAMQADSGEEAAQLIQSNPVHIAVVDLEIPVQPRSAGSNDRAPLNSEGGLRILKLLRRLDPAPPTIVVRPRQATERE